MEVHKNSEEDTQKRRLDQTKNEGARTTHSRIAENTHNSHAVKNDCAKLALVELPKTPEKFETTGDSCIEESLPVNATYHLTNNDKHEADLEAANSEDIE